jgi:hypothetical protein
MARRRRVTQDTRCPRGKCERCHDIGRESKRTCVAIPGPKNKAKHKFHVCDTCGRDIIRQWDYILWRIIDGGASV